MQKQTLQAKYQEMQNNLVSNILSVIENSDEKLRWFKYCDSSIFLPHNAGSKRVYNGGNRAHLALAAWINEYNDPRWMTFNQVRKAGYKVKKDTKGCRVMKWATVPIVEEDEDGNKTIRGSRLTLQAILQQCFMKWGTQQVPQED